MPGLLKSASTVNVLELSGARSSRLRSTLVDVAAKARSTAALAENTSFMQQRDGKNYQWPN